MGAGPAESTPKGSRGRTPRLRAVIFPMVAAVVLVAASATLATVGV